MKILRTIGILALVTGLVLGGVSSVFAKGPPDDPPGGGPHSPGKRGLFGTADSINGYDVTLVTKDGSTVVITLTDTAKYMVPGKTKGPVDRDDFETILGGDITAIEGERIAVLVTFTNEDTADVRRLMLIPSLSAPPVHAHRVGVVQAFTAGTSIEIIDNHGVNHTFDVSEDTVYRPDTITYEDITPEVYVTVVIKGDPKVGVVAKAIVLHDELPDWWPLP